MQQEVLELLEKNQKKMSLWEISEELGENKIKISVALRKLVKHREISTVEIDRNTAKEMFGERAPSRRMRLFYCCSTIYIIWVGSFMIFSFLTIASSPASLSV